MEGLSLEADNFFVGVQQAEHVSSPFSLFSRASNNFFTTVSSFPVSPATLQPRDRHSSLLYAKPFRMWKLVEAS